MFISMPIRGETQGRRARSRAGIALACLMVGGCAVGPNFAHPSPPKADSYGAAYEGRRLEADGATQTVELGRPTNPTWWRLFGSPQLDGLVKAGLANSPSLAAARAALDQSREQARAGAGVFLPSLAGSATVERERSPPLRLGVPGQPSTFTLFTLGGSVNYVVDLFGGERRNVEALVATADRQRYALGAAYLALTGNIVDAAVARAGYAAQADALKDIVRLEAEQRDILTAQFKAGYGAWSSVLQAEQQLAADREGLALALQRQAASTTLLQMLIGREAGEDAPAPPTLDSLAVPEDAPVSLPSQIVRQRPDVLQAEAALHQASAQVGVATAALFPSINVTGDYGATSLSLGKLGSPQGVFWGIGPEVNVPIFQGGALWHARKGAQAAYRAAQANYRQTVLAALEQVADSIKALDADADVARASRSAFDAAQTVGTLAGINRRAGMADDYDEMTALIGADRARVQLIAAKAQRLQDVVALHLASGGGWTAQGGEGGLAAAAAP
jgi:NodT family efflux transporter outer membrane factor (OMF) lipoprotein